MTKRGGLYTSRVYSTLTISLKFKFVLGWQCNHGKIRIAVERLCIHRPPNRSYRFASSNSPPLNCGTGKRLYQRPNNHIIPHQDPHIPLHSPTAHIMVERDFGFATGGDAHLERRRKLGSGGSASVHEVPSWLVE